MDTLKSSQNHDSKSPNYMKSTSSSDSKKETRTLTGSVRTLMKRHSFKPVRVKATCSSTLKDSKFPDFVKLNNGGSEAQGTSAMRVCPYLYCSLNGHHHGPSPPLKTFLKAKRRSLKAQNGGGKVIIEPEAAMEEEGESSESFDLEWSEVDGEYVGTLLKVASEVTDQIVDFNFHVGMMSKAASEVTDQIGDSYLDDDDITDQNKEEYDGVLVTDQIVDSNFHVDDIVDQNKEQYDEVLEDYKHETEFEAKHEVNEQILYSIEVEKINHLQLGFRVEYEDLDLQGKLKTMSNVDVLQEQDVIEDESQCFDDKESSDILVTSAMASKQECEENGGAEVDDRVKEGEVIDESVESRLKVVSGMTEVDAQVKEGEESVGSMLKVVSELTEVDVQVKEDEDIDEFVESLSNVVSEMKEVDAQVREGEVVEEFVGSLSKVASEMTEVDVQVKEGKDIDELVESLSYVVSKMAEVDAQVGEGDVVEESVGSLSKVASEMTEVDVQVKEGEVIDEFVESLSYIVSEMTEIDAQVKEGEVVKESVGSLSKVASEMTEVDVQVKEGEVIDEFVESLSYVVSEMIEIYAQVKEGEVVEESVSSLSKVASEMTEVDVQVKEGEVIDEFVESLSNVVSEMIEIDAQVKEGEAIDESVGSPVKVVSELTEVDAHVKEDETNNEFVGSLSILAAEMTHQVVSSRLHIDNIVDQNETKSDRALHHQQETESEAKDEVSELKSSFEVQNTDEYNKSNSNPKLKDAFIPKPTKSQEMLREADLNTKRIIGSKKSLEKLNAYTSFNPREPNYLPIVPEKESEKIDLKHQMIDERRNGNEWMIDYALQQTVTKLAPARKRRVALLVEAFESVLPMPSYELPPKPVFAHARPIQACN